jgi:Zn-dependent protease
MIEQLYVLPVLLFSVVVHEIAHGWMALRCGDPTARDHGRLTLNPIPHLDLFGSIIIPLLSLFSAGQIFIAWAKPVPVNPMLFHHQRRDEVLVSVIGPFSNLVVALLCSLGTLVSTILYASLWTTLPLIGTEALIFLIKMFHAGIYLNIFLAMFNLIPIPPLDGSYVLASLMPESLAIRYRAIGFFGIIVIIVLMQINTVYSMILSLVEAIAVPFEWIVSLAL